MKVEHLTATQFGWVKRDDLGPRVWETLNGSLYQHHSDSEPLIERADLSDLFPHLKNRPVSSVGRAADL